MIPVSAFLTSKSAAWISLRRMFSTSSPTYPASVSAVASAIANGTLRIRASVCARRVLPQPGGPSSMMLDFWSSTSSSSDCDRESALGGLLSDHVLVEDGVDLPRLGQALELERGGRRELLVDDLVAEIDALVADVDAWPGDQLLDLSLGLPAEAAEKLLVRIGWACQALSPFDDAARAPRLRLRHAGRLLDPRLLLGRYAGPCKRRWSCRVALAAGGERVAAPGADRVPRAAGAGALVV